MKSKILNIMASVLVVLGVGCNDETEELLAPKVLKADMYFEVGGGSGQIELSAPPENVRVVSGDQWCSASKDGSVVNVSVQANTTISGRTALIALSYRGIEDILVTVSQRGAVFDIANPLLETGCKAASLRLTIRQDAPVSNLAPDVDWLHPTMDADTLVVAVDDNKSLSARTGTIEVTSAGVTIPVTVTQEAMIFSIAQRLINSAVGGGTYSVTVVSDFDFTPVTSETWLHPSIDANTVVVVVDAFTGGSGFGRNGIISVVSGVETLAVSVKQSTREPTYAELLGEYTFKAKLYSDWYYPGTEFVSTLRLEALNPASRTYSATIENYLPDNSFLGYGYGTPYQQFPLTVRYSNGTLVIRNNQLIAEDCVDFFDIYWDVYFFAAAAPTYYDYSTNPNLSYVGQWNGSQTTPVFTFVDGGYSANFKVVGFVPFWWDLYYDGDYDMLDLDLFLGDWEITKNDPIP